MIFPQDYKYVGVSDHIPEVGDPIYFSTRFIIVKDKMEVPYQIYTVKSCGEGLIRRITSIKLLADQDEITVLDEPLESCNNGVLVEVAERLCSGKINTVVLTGIDKHTTFIHKPDTSKLFEIEVIDITPPNPPWLAQTVRRLHAAGVWSRLPVRFTEKIVDLRQFEGRDTMFPCRSSDLRGEYLDAATTAPDETILVGCEISLQIFNLQFPGRLKEHINTCPLREELYTPTKPFITRCCQSERTGEITLNGIRGMVVHWGASEYDVIEAVRNLYRECNSEDE